MAEEDRASFTETADVEESECVEIEEARCANDAGWMLVHPFPLPTVIRLTFELLGDEDCDVDEDAPQLLFKEEWPPPSGTPHSDWACVNSSFNFKYEPNKQGWIGILRYKIGKSVKW